MKVVCDNCRAVYRIPDEKLVKEVNKATCRNCGHKMLIPRPKPGTDPDEPTNVRAVPPTPMGAPARKGGRNYDENDNTMPRGVGSSKPQSQRQAEVPLSPGTPLGASQRAAEPSRQAAQAPAAQPAFDPSGDMVLAMLGALSSIVGALILAVDDHVIVIGIGLFIALTGSFTTLMVLATGNRGRRAASKAISIALSPLIALLAAAIVVGIHFGAESVMKNGIRELAPANDAAAQAAAAQAVANAEPEEAPAEEAEEPAAEEEPTEGDAVAEAPAAEPQADAEPTPAPTSSSTSSSSSSSSSTSRSSGSSSSSRDSSSRTTSTRSSGSSSSGSSSSRSSSSFDDDDLFGDDDDFGSSSSSSRSSSSSSSSNSDLPDSIPVDTIDLILRNNKDVKLCFAGYYKENGALPPRVDVRFTVASSGSVTAAEVTNAEYAATALDTCMSRALKKLTFPPTSGSDKKYNYPFILQ